MFEDQEDKIRRNLFVYSSLVIAAWWLDVSPTQVAQSQLVFLNDVPVSKILSLTFFVQIYLLVRYRFSRLSQRVWREYKVEVGRLIRSKVISDISERLRYFDLNSESSLFKPKLREYLSNEEEEHIGKDGLQYKTTEMSLAYIDFQGAWAGDIRCSRVLTHSDGSYSRGGGRFGLGFQYDEWGRFVIRTKAAFAVIFYTRGAIELLLPVVLGFASALIICLQLLSTLN